MARLTPFEVGQIKAHLYHDMSPKEIADLELVIKGDGEPVSMQAVYDVRDKLDADPSWRGLRRSGSRP